MPISPPPPPRALALLGLLCLVLVASWPSWGSLGSGLVSDDGAALGYAHRASSPWLDWTGAQYDLASVRFWRPMVTTSLALQERMSGVAPVPLRLFNLLGHVVTAILLALVARELGAGRFGSLLTGLLAGLFPDQGGTVTWIVGRVDSLAAPLAVGALLAALRGRGWLAGLATLAACATKEIAFVLPVWVALGALGAGRKPAAALRATSPVALAAGLAFLARRQALGTWIGGYTQVGRPELDLLACAQAWSEVVWPALLLLAGAVAIGLIAGNAHPRAWACALGVALVAALPLAHVLGVGEVEDVHRRTLWFSDLGLCLACGLALGRAREPSRARAWGLACALLLIAGLTTRGSAARADVDEWASAGRRAEALVTQTREAMAQDEASELPALAAWFARTHAGAYLFQWGVADRFRPPFELGPRPVWPWRPIFAAPGSERPSPFVARQGLIRPEERAGSQVSPILVSVEGQPLLGPLVVGKELVLEPGQPDPGPVLELWGALPGARRIEFVLYTELGYEPGIWSAPSAPEQVAEGPFGAGQRRRISLREILLCADTVALFQAAVQAEDLGARRAYLEVRAVDDEEGSAQRVLAASAWIELELEPGLAQLMLP